MHFVLLDPIETISYNFRHGINASKWLEDWFPDEHQKEEEHTKVAYKFSNEPFSTTNVVIISVNNDFGNDDWVIVGICVCSLLSKSFLNVMLDLIERAFVWSANAIFNVHFNRSLSSQSSFSLRFSSNVKSLNVQTILLVNLVFCFV